MSHGKRQERKRGCLLLLIPILSLVLVLLIGICFVQTKQKMQPQQTGQIPQTSAQSEPTQASTESTTEVPTEAPTQQPTEAPTEPSTEIPTEPSTEEPAIPVIDGEPLAPLVVIDAGHQRKGNSQKEPVGPGAAEMKAKVTSGTQGVVTKQEEYELNMSVAEKLRAELENRGYRVQMVRTTHDVDISNSERAAVANDLGADVFIRIHANGDSNPNTQGMMTVCQTASNPYNGHLYEQSKKLSQLVLEETVNNTGAKKQFVWETDTMSGINWCQVPVTIVEMGYLSNPEEDVLLSTQDYQDKIAEGIANGIDRYFQ